MGVTGRARIAAAACMLALVSGVADSAVEAVRLTDLAPSLGHRPAAPGRAQTSGAAREQDRRPRITVKAQPQVAIAPARIVITAELVGGADNFEEYYCPSIEWDWGDDTRSESNSDCAPFEDGKSTIRRRFTVEHVYRRAGAYKIFFRMKRRDKAVATGSATVQVRPGGPEEF